MEAEKFRAHDQIAAKAFVQIKRAVFVCYLTRLTPFSHKKNSGSCTVGGKLTLFAEKKTSFHTKLALLPDKLIGFSLGVIALVCIPDKLPLMSERPPGSHDVFRVPLIVCVSSAALM